MLQQLKRFRKSKKEIPNPRLIVHLTEEVLEIQNKCLEQQLGFRHIEKHIEQFGFHTEIKINIKLIILLN